VEFFNVNGWEFILIAVVAVLIIGPDRLPKMLAEGVKWLRILRDQAANARREIVAVADLDPAMTDELRRSVADIAELHPKRIVSSLIDDTSTSLATPPPAKQVLPPAPAVAAAGAAVVASPVEQPIAPAAPESSAVTAAASNAPATPAPAAAVAAQASAEAAPAAPAAAVNGYGASAQSSSFAPRPADAPAAREATPPASFDADAT
jgi:sec-independent protein translocase protein TatB